MYQKRLLQVIFVVIVQLSISYQGVGQDIHYSQFYNSPQNLNPALTGVFNGDHRFTLSHRDQWRFVPVPWTTFSAAYDRNILPYNSEKYFYGFGLNINYDRQGDAKLTLINAALNGAFHYLLNSKNILSLGGNVGYATKGFDTKSLRWGNQWDGEVFNTNLDNQEGFQNTERVNYLETGLGLNYRYQKSARTYVDLGGSLLHLLEPKVSFKSENDVKLPRRLTMSGVGNFKLTEHLDLQLHALHQIQSKYKETVLGGLGKIYLNQNRGKELQLHLGLGYRTSGSLIPTAALQYNAWYVSFNFDVDSTPYNDALDTNRGAYELHLRYIIKNVKPFRFKNCPIL
ncbi:MAG: PorP/SprF family type IX secretion system membrane protein [Saprospiraceae bacterium]|jgi:type IX secretion system PorP/SprF family membrane protein